MYNITDGKIYIFEDKISSVAKEELENVIGILLELFKLDSGIN